MPAEQNDPVISVVLPVLNAQDTVRKAALSILHSSLPLELILIDDGSTDRSLDEMRTLLDDDRVRLFARRNTGLAATLNWGIELSRGVYIARMDADDVSLPGRLESQLDAFRSDPSLVLLGTQVQRSVGDHILNVSNFPSDHRQIISGLLRGQHVISHPSVMMRRSAVRDAGSYWRWGVSEDWDLFLKMSDLGKVGNLDHPYLQYRYSTSSINARSMKQVRANIGLAIMNHERRQSGKPELDPGAFQAALSVLDRLKLELEQYALRLYRCGMSWSISDSLPRRIVAYLLVATGGILKPSFSARRVRQKAQQYASGMLERAE